MMPKTKNQTSSPVVSNRKTLLKHKDRDLLNEYFHWLCDLIEVNAPDKSYWFLANDLHRREFFWLISNDDNRANDGRNLRDLFADDEKYDDIEPINGPCTVLEMLIGLAMRMDGIMADLDNTNRTSKWFWEIITNVGLDKFNDDVYFELNGEININTAIDIILERTYRRNGKGGLFPLKFNKKDQRKVEIWYQMSEYLLENYYLDEKIMC